MQLMYSISSAGDDVVPHFTEGKLRLRELKGPV